MKKTIIFLTAFTLFSFAALSSVYAYPSIEVEGFVDPYSAGSIVDNGTTTTFSELTYYFNVTYADPGAEMNYISLEFENDVFASFGSVISSIPNWNYSLLPSADSIYQIGSAGAPIGMGDQLLFVMEDVEVYNGALIDDALWQEGQIWGQSFSATDSLGGRDGGSTSALSPEPISSTLFIVGGIAFGFMRLRKRGFKQ